jgi:hypothetical protein
MDDAARPGEAQPQQRRAARTAGPDRRRRLRHQEHHREANWLRDVILGGQDGLVNILGIILGVIAGG